MTLPRALALCLLLAASTACSSSPTAPTPGLPAGPRAGTWVGSLNDAVNGGGAVRLQLDEFVTGTGQSVLSGSWTSTFSDATRNGSGAISGFISGGIGQMTLLRTVALTCPPGPFAAVAGSFVSTTLAIGATAIGGDYQFTTCTGSVPGTLEVHRP